MGDPLERMRVYQLAKELLKDRARIFEYALGSAGESEEWYDASRPVLGEERAEERIKTLREIQRMLKAIIPRERNRLIRPHRQPV